MSSNGELRVVGRACVVKRSHGTILLASEMVLLSLRQIHLLGRSPQPNAGVHGRSSRRLVVTKRRAVSTHHTLHQRFHQRPHTDSQGPSLRRSPRDERYLYISHYIRLPAIGQHDYHKCGGRVNRRTRRLARRDIGSRQRAYIQRRCTWIAPPGPVNTASDRQSIGA